MTQKEAFRAMVGLMIVGSLALGVLVTPWAFVFTAFIGLNMFQSAFSRFCPLDNLLRRTGMAGCPEAKAPERIR
ncbi:MAG: DUF2892 domain-containing protein [Candidatus Eisenbacteria bacterium]